MSTHQVSFAFIEGPDSIVQLLYGNRHPATEIDDNVSCPSWPLDTASGVQQPQSGELKKRVREIQDKPTNVAGRMRRDRTAQDVWWG